jgi:hypothetical protein
MRQISRPGTNQHPITLTLRYSIAPSSLRPLRCNRAEFEFLNSSNSFSHHVDR